MKPSQSDLTLTDGVVTLRPPDERDLPAIERALGDRDISRAFGHNGQTAAELLELNRERWRDGTGPTFAICRGAGECVGHVWVNSGRSGRAAVGYWLLPEGRGTGLATRAVRLISRWAFDVLGVERLELFTAPWNEKSQCVAKRAGFRREGLLRSCAGIDGRRADQILFALLPFDLAESSQPR